MEIIKEVENFFLIHKIENEPVIVAFSGGYDSMCLLHVVFLLKQKFNFKIIACHLNHNWRAEESKLEAERCHDFCNNWGIEFYTETLSDDIKHTENDARIARYDFFARCANKFNAKYVLSAHNADDNAETIIYRLAKGTGLEGLKGISKMRKISLNSYILRPLLTVYREDIELYCFNNNLTPNKDSSNENTKYKRNLIRKNIMPELKNINPKVLSAINSLSENAISDAEIINEYLNNLPDKSKTRNFIAFSKPVQNRIIYNLLLENNLNCDKSTINRIINHIVNNSSVKCGKLLSLDKETHLCVNSESISIVKNSPSSESILIVDNTGEFVIGNCKFTISKCETCPDNFPKDSEAHVFVDLTDFDFPLTIRTRQMGDKINPLGMQGAKTLKKYFEAKGIAKILRDKIFFLCDNNEVLWIPTLGISNKIKTTQKPTHELKMEIINEN